MTDKATAANRPFQDHDLLTRLRSHAMDDRSNSYTGLTRAAADRIESLLTEVSDLKKRLGYPEFAR